LLFQHCCHGTSLPKAVVKVTQNFSFLNATPILS
jgi:hypothetical protein